MSTGHSQDTFEVRPSLLFRHYELVLTNPPSSSSAAPNSPSPQTNTTFAWKTSRGRGVAVVVVGGLLGGRGRVEKRLGGRGWGG